MTDEKIVNTSKMIANQQAYNTDGAKDEEGNYIVQDGERVHVGGAQFVSIDKDGRKELLERQKDVQNEKPISHTMIRTDVDSHKDYKVPGLQNQIKGSNENDYFGSSLNITSYNVYDKDGSQSEKPETVIVGVAGSAGNFGTSPDWRQNLGILNRSQYNGKSTSELKAKLLNASIADVPLIHYELEMREKVDELKRYRQNNIPITLVGDSKGGEDAAYLALSVVKSTQPRSNRVDSYDNTNYRDYSAVSLYLTNPKGIRVSGNESDETSDYGILCKMAKEGRIIKEIVYPEIVHNGFIPTDGRGVNDGREIPVSKTIYTVPKDIRNLTENHTIGNYENDVFQGAEANYKFQCDEEPKAIIKPIIFGAGGIRVIGYCYKVTRITNKAGNTVSVNEYFFEEQKAELKRLQTEMEVQIRELKKLSDEPLLDMFSNKAREKRSKLEDKHAQLMINANSLVDYAQYRKNNGMDEIILNYKLAYVYAAEAEKQAQIESDDYGRVVRNVVSRYIDEYKESLETAKRHIDGDLQAMKDQGIVRIDQAKEKFNESQSEIQMIIKKFY